MDMDWILIEKIFNNASVAGILTVGVGGLIGVMTFWKQRKETKIENLSGSIELIVEKCEQVNLILDRMSNTYLVMKNKGQSFPPQSIKEELTEISLIINDEIPKLRAKIKNYVGFYFSEKNKVVNKTLFFFNDLKKWHDNAVGIAITDGYAFDKRIKDNPKFSLDEVKAKAKDLRKALK